MFTFLKKIFHHEQTTTHEKIISGVIAFLYVVFMGTLGSKAINSEWFASLTSPEWMPKADLFPFVWGVLFVLLGLSAYFAWNQYESKTGRSIFTALYVLNGLLMAAWTDQFFVKHAMVKGLVILLLLIIVIESMIITGFYTNKKSSYLLFPYLIWIFFAIALNAGYLILN